MDRTASTSLRDRPVAARSRQIALGTRLRFLLAAFLAIAFAVAAESAVADVEVTFGNETPGLGYYDAGSGFKRVSRFTLESPMTVQKLRAYVDGRGSGSGAQVARAVIYADALGEPGALLAVGDPVTIADGQQVSWVDFAFARPVALKPGAHWLGLHFGGAEATIRFRNTFGSGQSRVQTFDTYADGPSDPFGITYPYADPHSIYAVGSPFPIRAAFYYPWYPETWKVGGKNPHFTPSLGFYSSTNAQTQVAHIDALSYAGLDAAISSWWGRNHYSNDRLRLLLDRTVTVGSPLRWALYYEPEDKNNSSPQSIASDLAHVRDTLASSPAYLRIGGRFVVFVYNGSDLSCDVANRWKSANALIGNAAYVVLKVFSGYHACSSQPDAWHQYSPTVSADHQAGYSYSISPGFWLATESTPRLSRNLSRFRQAISDMAASGAPWQLVTTFNEWGEGTAVESAEEWASPSGYGSYLDALRETLLGAPPAEDTTPPSAPANLVATGATQTSVSLSWSAASDDVGVSEYRVYRDGALVGTTTATSFTVTGLACGTSYQLAVEARDAAGNVSSRSTVTASTSACPPSANPVIAAAGDIACAPASSKSSTTCHHLETSDLLVNKGYARVLTLGDNQYEDGTLSAYQQSYDPSWGRVKSITSPVPGNHEYHTSGASGYYGYFGALAGDPAKGYYSFDVGPWHLIALNSEISHGATSTQVSWLKSDLAANTSMCTLAYWHKPRFSSGDHGSDQSFQPFWDALYAANADVVLSGHDHYYERFAPQTPGGAADAARGIRQFVVGTGGKGFYTTFTSEPNSQVHNSNTFGVLELTLRPAEYDWRFVPEAGKTFQDTGTGSCH